ncbi:hypothetical protein ONS96_005440 [Cadophora gregata f. sp. sojae]|nr:hypothetical protein ONS96_005440 [Cadophora gregata f. sp. sojae]
MQISTAMDASTLFPGSQLGHPKGYEQPVESPDSAILMDMIFQYLREDPPKASLSTPVDAKVKTWAATLPDFQVSPIGVEMPKYSEHDDSSVHSSSSPLESAFSDSSSLNDSNGPKTPPLTKNITATVSSPARDDELMFPDMPKLPPPAPPANKLNRNCSLRRSSEVVRSPSRAASTSRRMSFGLPPNSSNSNHKPESVLKIPAAHQRTYPTIASLVPLPETAPSPSQAPLNKTSNVPPQLRISTQSSAPSQSPPLVHPEWELCFPTTRPTYAERKAQKYRDQVRQSAPIPDHTKELLRTLEERKISPSRQSITFSAASSPTSRLESINRLKASRQSMQIQIPAQIQRHPIQEVPIHTQAQKTLDEEFLRSLKASKTSPTRYSVQFPLPRPSISRRSSLQVTPTRSPLQTLPEHPIQIPRKPVATEPTMTRLQRKAEIEKIPSVRSDLLPAPPKTSVQSGIWFTKGFLAGREGMQIKMTRRVTNFSKMEWVIENDDGAKILKSFGHSNSLSRKTGKYLA